MPRAESLSDIDISDPSQKFQPREDDDQTLHEVIEITDEKHDQYKVRWEGEDPKTGKPWALSWVPKEDCTADLVLEWKTKKKKKGRRNSKKKGLKSVTSKSTSYSNSVSTSVTTAVGKSNGTNSRSTSNAIGSRNNSHPSEAQPKNRKRKFPAILSSSSRRSEALSFEVNSDDNEQDIVMSNPPKKKRRIDSEALRSSLTMGKKTKQARPQNGVSARIGLITNESESDESELDEAALAEELGTTDEEQEKIIEAALVKRYRDDLLRKGVVNSDTRRMKDKGKGKVVPPSREHEETGSEDMENRKPARLTKAKRPVPGVQPQYHKPPSSVPVKEKEAVPKKKLKEISVRIPLFEVDSDSDGPLPIQSPEETTQFQFPESHVASSSHLVQDSEESDSQRRLSPAARRRLEIFDAEVMGRNTAVKKQAKKMNGVDASTARNTRPAKPNNRPSPHLDDSNRTDIVPETELETSQEERLQLPSKHQERNADGSPIDSFAIGSSKSLRPLPHISPSTFHPHLQPPDSSLPDTIIPFSSNERRAEVESIEQFESPEKGTNNVTKKVVLLNKSGSTVSSAKTKQIKFTNGGESAETSQESELSRRGQVIVELAEVMRKQVSAPSTESGPDIAKKKSLQDVVARAQSRNRSESIANQLEEDEVDLHEEEGVADASTAVAPPASGLHALSQESSPPPPLEYEVPLPIDDVGLDDGLNVETEGLDITRDDVDEAQKDVDLGLLRQEEEEDTQDIMAEMKQYQEQIKEVNEDDDQELDPPLTPSPSPFPPPASTTGVTEELPANSLTRRSLAVHRSESGGAQSRSVTATRLKSKTPSLHPLDEARGTKDIPSPDSIRSDPVGVEPPKSPVREPQGVSSSTSAQITSLASQVVEKQSKIDSLQHYLDSLREQLITAKEQVSQLEASTHKQVTEVQSRLADEKSAWEKDREQLTSQSLHSENLRIQAEKDREFFREQYANASAFVTTVRQENEELELRAKVAEEQARTGVELVKTTFEQRNAKLQDDVKAWRRMAEFVIEKDTRTNDSVRRRAAEEPELRMLCIRQRKGLKESRTRIEHLQAELQEKSELYNASSEELEYRKKESAKFQLDLNEALIKLDRIGRSGDDSEGTQGNGHEFVYRCLWRTEVESTPNSCSEVFVSMRELEQHIYSGHIPQH